MAWVEKDHSIIEFQPPCYVQGHQQLDQASQSHIQPGLEHLQGWGIHNLPAFKYFCGCFFFALCLSQHQFCSSGDEFQILSASWG